MNEQPTCGKGLAATAALSAKIGELITAVAEILEVHVEALDLTDENSRKEYRAYQQLAAAHHLAGRQLTTIGEQMAGYRDLPMGRHDMAAMGAPGVRASFERFVELEHDLVVLLEGRIAEDRQMLERMEVTA